MSIDLHNYQLYSEVSAARVRLRELEMRFDALIRSGAANLDVGREYAAAVQDYTQAVMTLLSWVETETVLEARRAKPSTI